MRGRSMAPTELTRADPPSPLLSPPSLQGAVVDIKRGRSMAVTGGVISELRRLKDVVREVGQGVECGVQVANFDGWAEGDIIEAFLVSACSL